MAGIVWRLRAESVRFSIVRDVIPNITILVPFTVSFDTGQLSGPVPMVELRFASLADAQRFGNALLRHADAVEQDKVIDRLSTDPRGPNGKGR
ncbi:unnamed protein product [marine sediment metagenome]|uniref:Uncharacterized protein n=1 Tax=marine sediment metagenome TaxID=412755 RepID=X1V611_9ZZZZ